MTTSALHRRSCRISTTSADAILAQVDRVGAGHRSSPVGIIPPQPPTTAPVPLTRLQSALVGDLLECADPAPVEAQRSGVPVQAFHLFGTSEQDRRFEILHAGTAL